MIIVTLTYTIHIVTVYSRVPALHCSYVWLWYLLILYECVIAHQSLYKDVCILKLSAQMKQCSSEELGVRPA